MKCKRKRKTGEIFLTRKIMMCKYENYTDYYDLFSMKLVSHLCSILHSFIHCLHSALIFLLFNVCFLTLIPLATKPIKDSHKGIKDLMLLEFNQL